MAEIHINSMAFFAHHGCFEEERKIGTNFVVDCEFETDTTLAEESDDINDTVNYLDVYQLIKKEMEKPSHLLEHVARRIINAILKTYPEVKRCKVRVQKMNPPLGGQMQSVSVTLQGVQS
ncbi:MAG: dihydroneopterin aldolase [Bacteroidales bacterium]|nr:dihydroneopterin aldolase [Bacteroidales bacterium]